MRLICPSPGEAMDRLTILELKLATATRLNNERAAMDFAIEKESIELYLAPNFEKIPISLQDELRKINARLWDLEDTQRNLLSKLEEDYIPEISPACEILANAITVIRLNDARAETVKKINEACNVHQQEKLYATN